MNDLFFSLQTAFIWSEKKGTVIFIEIYSIFSFCLAFQIISLIQENVGVILIPQISTLTEMAEGNLITHLSTYKLYKATCFSD